MHHGQRRFSVLARPVGKNADGHVKWIHVNEVNRVYAAQGSSGNLLTSANSADYPIVLAWKR